MLIPGSQAKEAPSPYQMSGKVCGGVSYLWVLGVKPPRKTGGLSSQDPRRKALGKNLHPAWARLALVSKNIVLTSDHRRDRYHLRINATIGIHVDPD